MKAISFLWKSKKNRKKSKIQETAVDGFGATLCQSINKYDNTSCVDALTIYENDTPTNTLKYRGDAINPNVSQKSSLREDPKFTTRFSLTHKRKRTISNNESSISVRFEDFDFLDDEDCGPCSTLNVEENNIISERTRVSFPDQDLNAIMNPYYGNPASAVHYGPQQSLTVYNYGGQEQLAPYPQWQYTQGQGRTQANMQQWLGWRQQMNDRLATQSVSRQTIGSTIEDGFGVPPMNSVLSQVYHKNVMQTPLSKKDYLMYGLPRVALQNHNYYGNNYQYNNNAKKTQYKPQCTADIINHEVPPTTMHPLNEEDSDDEYSGGSEQSLHIGRAPAVQSRLFSKTSRAAARQRREVQPSAIFGKLDADINDRKPISRSSSKVSELAKRFDGHQSAMPRRRGPSTSTCTSNIVPQGPPLPPILRSHQIQHETNTKVSYSDDESSEDDSISDKRGQSVFRGRNFNIPTISSSPKLRRLPEPNTTPGEPEPVYLKQPKRNFVIEKPRLEKKYPRIPSPNASPPAENGKNDGDGSIKSLTNPFGWM
ncbi:unnamed protein product [Owenia fusiformis]|uniref:Uncharacterized protein n=1 Tax=Owenia fusiformis TaxID=6347 RepID=A0A8J1YAK6_OWEFU|nr:unnamed protein product [Owenia fusiformis]